MHLVLEIGECPNLKADIKVIDESPFFIRPFPISEKDKPFMDEQMERLVSLGILSKNSTSHTSPDLSDSALSRKEKSRLMKMLIKYRDAFSLRDR